MSESSNDRVRDIYEPRYGRCLSDMEAQEISANLTAFAEGILEAAGLCIQVEKPTEKRV